MKTFEIKNYDGDSKKHIETVTHLVKELKKSLKKEGILQDLRLKESYMSPSKKKRYKRNEARKRRVRDARKQEWYRNNKSDNDIV